MNHSYPIYTVETECQDCYKCVRRCPVKAIKVKDGHATVIPERCVGCGRCVEVCPAHAKQVRNDIGRARHLLEEGGRVFVSLAPSWVNEYPNLDASQLIQALQKLGFTGVSETALGAQLVSAEVARQLKEQKRGLVLSSACPVAVDYIGKYLPDFTGCISPLLSPVLAHCRLLRDRYGEAIKIVFISPCIAKKNEADRHPDLLNLALTYPELSQMFQEAGIHPEAFPKDPAVQFVPFQAEEGAIYPIEGGMNETIQLQCDNPDLQLLAVTGLENLQITLQGLYPENVTFPTFLETLSCHGGCVHGPCSQHKAPGLQERQRVLKHTRLPAVVPERRTDGSIENNYAPSPAQQPLPSLTEERDALRRIGKFTPEDELNCGGCGYDSCREFARALIAGNAEPSMCVSYMRKQAQKKANGILRCIPSGVVIVDKELSIIECNRNFAVIFGEDTVDAFEASPGLAGADLRRIVPFANLFEAALKSGNDIQRDAYKVGNHLYNITIFNIESHEVLGAVIFDVTQTDLRREQIAERARKVIAQNLATVQEIACKLGEHAADTELLLRSIADDYADEEWLSKPSAE